MHFTNAQIDMLKKKLEKKLLFNVNTARPLFVSAALVKKPFGIFYTENS